MWGLGFASDQQQWEQSWLSCLQPHTFLEGMDAEVCRSGSHAVSVTGFVTDALALLSIMALALVEWLGESCWCVAVGHQCAWMVPSLSSSTLTLVVLGVSPEDPVQVEVDALDLIGRRLVGTSSGSREWQARRISRRIRCKMAWRIPSNTWWMIVRGIPGSQYWMIGWSIAWRFIENISWRIQWTI